eukprot:Em0298g6a
MECSLSNPICHHAYTLHHRSPALVPFRCGTSFNGHSPVPYLQPSGILFYQINSVMTDFLGVKLHGGLPWLIFDGHVVLFEQASNTFYVTVDTVHTAAITAAIVPTADHETPDGFDAVLVQNVLQSRLQTLHSSWNMVLGVIIAAQPAQHEEDSPPGGPPDPESDTDDIVISIFYYKIINPDKSFGSSDPMCILLLQLSSLLVELTAPNIHDSNKYCCFMLGLDCYHKTHKGRQPLSWLNEYQSILHKRFHTLFDLLKYELMPKYNVDAPGHKEHEEPLAISIPSHYWMENYSSLGSKFRSRLPVARMQHEVLTQRAAKPCQQVMMLSTIMRTGGPLVSLTVPFGGRDSETCKMLPPRKSMGSKLLEKLAKSRALTVEKNKAKARARYKADPEKKKASVRDSYKADPEKKKGSVRDSYNADIESKQSAKRQRYQEDLEENRAAKRQRYQEDVEDNVLLKGSDIKRTNRYWNDPAVRLAKRAAERQGSPNYHYHPKMNYERFFEEELEDEVHPPTPLPFTQPPPPPLLLDAVLPPIPSAASSSSSTASTASSSSRSAPTTTSSSSCPHLQKQKQEHRRYQHQPHHQH